MKDDHLIQTPAYKTKLTDAETNILDKYFCSTREKGWRPSLIAFPHFQAFPCSVYSVAHSSMTGIFIDTMQNLQGLSFSTDSKTSMMQVSSLATVDSYTWYLLHVMTYYNGSG